MAAIPGIPSVDRIRELRRQVRLAAPSLDGRCGAVSEALERDLGLAQRWGHLRLLDGSVCWLHCWNQSAYGSVVDATADQFETLFPGDVLILATTDPLVSHYLAAPPGRAFDLQLNAGLLQLAVDGVSHGPWTNEPKGWAQMAEAVLDAMSPWPHQPAVRAFVVDYLWRRGLGPFAKRDLEGSIDLWAWQQREARRGRPWLPGDLERDGAGSLRARANAVEVRPASSARELAEAVELAERTFPRLHERTGRGPSYYQVRFPQEADLHVVAITGEQVVGLALASVSPDGAAATVGEVAVRHDHRGEGVGRAMLAELEARATARGLTRLALGADEEVAGFYIACGWEPRVQVTIRGPGRRTVLDRLRTEQLAGREVGDADEHAVGDVVRVLVAADGYDCALADELSAVDGCSAFVMFTRTLPPSNDLHRSQGFGQVPGSP